LNIVFAGKTFETKDIMSI